MSDTSQDATRDAANDAVAGFRLDCFSIYNWGTFDGRAWQIEPHGRNQLLTGDIGSGKSTLVDGLTTLLFPSHRIVYNKAAGAERQERNAYSYVRGAFGAVQDETTRQSRGQYLRDERSYSVLLARFRNEGFDLDVTLAQVWWLKRGERNPERFYVVANRPLELTRDFSNFGGNIPALKRRLRAMNHVHIEDSFERYAERFRRELGLNNQQALELFYQTVSLKSIDDLTHFIRKHMLEPTEVNDVLQRLLGDFDNLNAAHDAVAKAELQTKQLRPIVELGERHERERNELLALRGDRDALSAWFAAQAIELWRVRVAELSLEIAKRTDRRQSLDAQQSRMRDDETSLLVALREAGGDQLEAIERDIRTADEERTRRQTTATPIANWPPRWNCLRLQTIMRFTATGKQHNTSWIKPLNANAHWTVNA